MTDAAPPRPLWPRLLIVAAIAAGIVFAASRFGGSFSLDALAARETSFLATARHHPAETAAVLFGVYLVVTATSLPFATALTLLAAWLFRRVYGPVGGFAAAVAVVNFASTLGATAAFLASRHLLRDALRRKYAARLAGFEAALERDGAFYLFSLRLTPVVPFWLVNVVMGLTPLRTRTFAWVTQLGTLPGTCVFVFAGSQVPSLADLEQGGVGRVLWPGPAIALLLLAAFPWAARAIMRRP